MARKTDQITPPKQPAPPKPEDETDELRERIERLEQRLDDSILGDDGLAAIQQGVDRSPSGDTLKRAVTRSNIKRGSRKA